MREIKQIQEYNVGDKVYFLDPGFNPVYLDNPTLYINEYIIESISETKKGFRYGFKEEFGHYIGLYLFKTKKDINDIVKIKIQKRVDELNEIINNLK